MAISVAAAVVLAGGGTYLGQSLLGGSDAPRDSASPADDGRADPKPLRLDGHGASAESDSGSGDSYQLTGKAPDGPDAAPVYRAGKVEKTSVTALAKTLGLQAKPRQQNKAWLVSDGTDGMGPALRVSGTEEGQRGQWSYSRHSPGADTKCGKIPQPDKPPKCPSAGGAVAADEPSGTASSDGSANSSTDAAETNDGRDPISQQGAKEAAAPALRSLGLAEAELDASATNGALRTVTAQPKLNGLPVRGWDTTVTVDTSGEVVRGHGALAPLTKRADYPVLGAKETLAQLNENRPVPGGIQCVKEPCESGDGAESGDAGRPIDASDPVFQLAAHSSDGKRVLVPSWRFDVGDGKAVSYPALEPRHLAPAEKSSGNSGGDPGSPSTSAPGDPGGTTKPTPPGTGIDSYESADRTLTVHFWGGVCSDYTAKAKETADTVRITIEEEEKEPGGVCIKIAKSMSTKVTLDEPVGDRIIVDEDGKQLERR